MLSVQFFVLGTTDMGRAIDFWTQALGYVVSKGGGVPWRLKIRAPSFCNLSILHKVCVGAMLTDVVAILGSFDFVMGECDR